MSFSNNKGKWSLNGVQILIDISLAVKLFEQVCHGAKAGVFYKKHKEKQ